MDALMECTEFRRFKTSKEMELRSSKMAIIKFMFMNKCQSWINAFLLTVFVCFIVLEWNGLNEEYFKMSITDQFEEMKRAIDVIAEEIKDQNEVNLLILLNRKRNFSKQTQQWQIC